MNPATDQHPLARKIVDSVEALIEEAEAATRPLEVDPYRGRLFELFVTAHGAGFCEDEAQHDLTADGLCAVLSARWGLADATRSSIEQNSKLDASSMARMRVLWSVMRMWMEWGYAWDRFEEFRIDEE